jgi:sugar phosphate isomerase/epimerase
MSPREAILHRCFVNAPWNDLKDNLLDLFLEHRLQPEIGLEGTCLYDEDIAEFRKMKNLLEQRGLQCTLHAPFMDLAPGSLDPYILEKTREKLRRAVELATVFQPRSIVCHLQYEENKHGYVFDRWLSNSLETWRRLGQLAGELGTAIMLENTYETTPKVHRTVLSTLDMPTVGFCLDVGHLGAFAKASWRDWLPEILPWLGQLHIHDNTGDRDLHLAPGQGNFDFPGLFDFLRQNDCHPVITLEPHSREDLWQAIDYFERTGLLAGI